MDLDLPANGISRLLAEPACASRCTRAVRTGFRNPASPPRAEAGKWIAQFLPADALVPDAYRDWRPLVRDAMLFLTARLSGGRLAAKLAEQMQLPLSTPPEARLLRLIAKMPGLQKLGQVLARNRHLDPSLRKALSELEERSGQRELLNYQSLATL